MIRHLDAPLECLRVSAGAQRIGLAARRWCAPLPLIREPRRQERLTLVQLQPKLLDHSKVGSLHPTSYL